MKDADGKWIGWGVGDSGATVKTAKEKLKAHFSYASALDDTEDFGEDLQFVLATYQTRKNMDGYLPVLRTDGVLDYATQDALGMIAHENPELPMLFTAQGTGVDMWTGYPADVARAVADKYQWQPTGNYPASAFPMESSYMAGVDEVRVQLRNWLPKDSTRKGVLSGYSQGAIVMSYVWKHDIAAEDGEFHYLKDRIIGAVTWGNPCRELGVANGNKYAGWEIPTGRGITDDRLEDTPSWWYDFAHGANSSWGRDLYTDTPDDDAGDDCTAIWHIVENLDVSELFKRIAELVATPTGAELLGAYNAVVYAGAFFGSGTGPHVDYSTDPAVTYLRSIAA